MLVILTTVLFTSAYNDTKVNAQVTPGYTVFTDDVLGVSFEYPSTWVLQEKESRFDTGSDVIVGEGSNMFKIIGQEDTGQLEINPSDLVDIVETVRDIATADGGVLIEDIDLEKFNIDGKDTATFLYVSDTEVGELPSQVFIVNNDGVLWTFGYQDTKAQFDTPESQEVMNHIINSIKFLN